MRSLLLALVLVTPLAAAQADLFVVVGEDGVPTITSQKRRGAKILYRENDRGARPVVSASAPRNGAPEPGEARARAQRYAETVAAAASHYGLPQALIWAVMRVESHFHPQVISDRGAQGLMQLMPVTANEMGVDDPFDPEQNIYGGARYLRILANRFDGDLVLTLSGYHAGGGAVNQVGGIPYEQTAEYVRRVLNAYYAYQKRPPTADR